MACKFELANMNVKGVEFQVMWPEGLNKTLYNNNLCIKLTNKNFKWSLNYSLVLLVLLGTFSLNYVRG